MPVFCTQLFCPAPEHPVEPRGQIQHGQKSRFIPEFPARFRFHAPDGSFVCPDSLHRACTQFFVRVMCFQHPVIGVGAGKHQHLLCGVFQQRVCLLHHFIDPAPCFHRRVVLLRKGPPAGRFRPDAVEVQRSFYKGQPFCLQKHLHEKEGILAVTVWATPMIR